MWADQATPSVWAKSTCIKNQMVSRTMAGRSTVVMKIIMKISVFMRA